MIERPSPKGKRVSLFVTCLIDMIHPDTGFSVLKTLRHLDIDVAVPKAQTCCGQPGFNAGYRDKAREVAKQFLTAFSDAEVIVTASGSCAAMVRHEYPMLFADAPEWHEQARLAAPKTWEFTEFLVDGLGITDLYAALPRQQTIAFHDACHGYRLLHLGQAARTLVSQLGNAEISEMKGSDVCCGFGGLFSVKMADISGVMLRKKIDHIQSCQADCVLTGDVSCMMHINGGLSKQGKNQNVRHIADVLAEAITFSHP